MKEPGLSDLQRRNLKSWVRTAVECAGGQVNAANVSGRIDRPESFSDYGNAEQPARHCPIDVAVDIDLFNGDPIITRHMAELLGYGLVKLPTPHTRGAVMGALARSIKEAADSISALSDVSADGHEKCTKHIDRAIREVEESIIASLEVVSRLKQMREDSNG